jgi:hypothetical protein
MRVLGARHLLQGAAEALMGGGAREAGVGVDILHGLTDIGFAAFDRRWRRAALADAGITAGLAALGVTNW